MAYICLHRLVIVQFQQIWILMDHNRFILKRCIWNFCTFIFPKLAYMQLHVPESMSGVQKVYIENEKF